MATKGGGRRAGFVKPKTSQEVRLEKLRGANPVKTKMELALERARGLHGGKGD